MVKTFINQFSENTYVIVEKKQAVIIDPGAKFDILDAFIKENDLTVKYIILTHGHFDHIFSVNECLEAFECDCYIHENERDFLFDPNLNLSSTTYKRISVKRKSFIKTYKDSDTFELPYNNIEITHTPGHTRGSSCLSYKHFLFSGDTIFSNAVGRTDLPTGNTQTLTKSIRKIFDKFKNNTVVYPGHGTHSTILTLKEILKEYY